MITRLILALTALVQITALTGAAYADEFANLEAVEVPLEPIATPVQSLSNNKCVVDKNDPYDPGLAMTFGKYKGQCMDATTVRPPVVLSEDLDSISIANFYHNGRFWYARVPKNAVLGVAYQGTPFAHYLFGLIMVAHNQLRFKLSQPIELKAQSGDLNATDSVTDIIISSTITLPAALEYSIWHTRSYGIVTRIVSTTSRAAEEIWKDGDPVQQYTLNKPEIMNEIFLKAITKASDDAYAGRYRLLKNNCLTKTFDAWDAAIPKPKGVPRIEGHWWLARDEIIKPGLVGLKKRNVDFVQTNNMNDEVECAGPGQSLDGVVVEKSKLGAALALCRFKDKTK